jgi:hypothetical protein
MGHGRARSPVLDTGDHGSCTSVVVDRAATAGVERYQRCDVGKLERVPARL